jgi:hypothetical protein
MRQRAVARRRRCAGPVVDPLLEGAYGTAMSNFEGTAGSQSPSARAVLDHSAHFRPPILAGPEHSLTDSDVNKPVITGLSQRAALSFGAD